MKYFTFLLCLYTVAVVASAANPLKHLTPNELKFKTWAVLAAGSFGWDNYRHQADICHAFHALHNLGIPEDHIIVMMTDDIAYNKQNPYPGKVFNTESTTDYYAGVPHDYTGELVTADVFLKILSGEDMTVGSRKSLKSGPDDNVFIYYDDHGNYDALVFPDRTINSTDMQNIINTLTEKKMYKNLIIYIEACFSGSMFYKLNFPENVYVTTAAPVGVFSYSGCGNEYVDTAVCDVYSQAWINDLESVHKDDYTFSQQFDLIQKGLVGFSQGCWYGSEKLAGMSVAEFFGPSLDLSKRNQKTIAANNSYKISNFDFELEMAKKAYRKTPNQNTLKKLNREVSIRKAIDSMGAAIIGAAKPNVPYLRLTPCTACNEKDCECYKGCIEAHGGTCFEQGADPESCCAFECCNEQSCYVYPPKPKYDISKRDECTVTLTNAFSEACGREHPYLLSTTLLFIRVCKQENVDIDAALNEIQAQCKNFNISSF